jgi:hypothetical protein
LTMDNPGCNPGHKQGINASNPSGVDFIVKFLVNPFGFGCQAVVLYAPGCTRGYP